MESPAQNPPFVDGNKRTAITEAALFLLQNGRRLQTSNEELERITFWFTDQGPPLNATTSWFESYTVDVIG